MKRKNKSFFAVVCLGAALLASSPNSDSDFETATRGGIVPDTDQVQDFALNHAFRIFGNISGNMATRVGAMRDDGALYFGVINQSTGNFAIVVPAGTFTVRVCYGSGGPSTTLDDPTPVIVAGDTMRDETLSAIATHQVSGRVTGMDAGTFGSILFVSQDRRSGSSTFIVPGLGTYMANAPDATYDVFVIQIDPSFSALSFFPVGSVTVSGSDVMIDFAVGTLATLSGTVTMNVPIPPNSSMQAVDSSAAIGAGFDCNSALFAGGVAPVDQSTGAYRMRLSTGRSYNLSGSFPIHPADGLQSVGVFTAIDPTPVDLPGDTVRDEMVSAPTETITITGQVTVAGGVGPDIDPFAALADILCGTPISAYGRSAQTQQSGSPQAQSYTLVVAKDPASTCAMKVSGPQPSP